MIPSTNGKNLIPSIWYGTGVVQKTRRSAAGFSSSNNLSVVTSGGIGREADFISITLEIDKFVPPVAVSFTCHICRPMLGIYRVFLDY